MSGHALALACSCVLWCGGSEALVVVLLPLCFCLLGDTAELYFSPTMALVAQSVPKMRPRFAGGACAMPAWRGLLWRVCG